MIGGHLTATLKARISSKNKYGDPVDEWVDVISIQGFLDLSGGDSKYTTYNAKLQESTHIFICDYVAIPDGIVVGLLGRETIISAETTKMVINSKEYDVLLIDNPMELNRHLEFYLKYTGGQ
jgi:hypothetical protein